MEANKQTPIVLISADELRRIIAEVFAEEREKLFEAWKQHDEAATVTRQEALRQLGVAGSTLWHWEARGYLVPIRRGTKVFYRQSDIDRLTGKEGSKI